MRYIKKFNENNNSNIKNFLIDKPHINKRCKTFFYHGTNILPENFELRDDYDFEDSHTWSGDLPEGYLFLTTSIQEASAYGKYIIPCELKQTNNITFKINGNNPSQVFDRDYGIDLYGNDEDYNFWSKFEDSMKSVLIIKGTTKSTLITDIENVIPRTDLAIEFYNGSIEKTNESVEQLSVEILTPNELLKLIYDYDEHEYKDDIFNRIRYFSSNDLRYNENPILFVVLSLNAKIIGISKFGYYSFDANTKNDYSISFFSIDKNYRGNNYARLMCDKLFKYAKDNNLEISTSSYTVLGKEKLEHLFIEYANKYGVKFYSNERMHDYEEMYKTVDGKKLHISEID